MKKISVLIIGLCLFISSFGQDDHKKRPSFGVQFTLTDFRTAQNLRSGGLANVIRAKDWSRTTYMTSGLAVSYLQGLNNNLDFQGTLSGTFVDYPITGKPARVDPLLLLEGSATVNLKLLSDKYYVSPFLTAGVGASKYGGYYAAFMPFGLGAQVKIVDGVFLMWNSQYRVPVTENASYHFYHALGVVAPLTKKKEPVAVVVIPVVEPPKDRDGDGVLDVDDKCPDVAG
ncbi:MAG TPA: hypothetical protein VHL77_01445, partial [Ferruginibacter sp.]|nr:hypothetical protein [Ferruginibacter sp.]